ncbi:MAG: hypothetical protein SFU86_18515 [Pirellulaceae bacterium]|nr:hypothetical protein [Pirellulaceae bacterium]
MLANMNSLYLAFSPRNVKRKLASRGSKTHIAARRASQLSLVVARERAAPRDAQVARADQHLRELAPRRQLPAPHLEKRRAVVREYAFRSAKQGIFATSSPVASNAQAPAPRASRASIQLHCRARLALARRSFSRPLGNVHSTARDSAKKNLKFFSPRAIRAHFRRAKSPRDSHRDNRAPFTTVCRDRQTVAA